MTYAAIDLHKTASQIRIIADDGTTDCRIPTTRDRLQTTFEGRERMRILLEAATESEWVAQLLEALGHEVVVADPNYTRMYGERSRRIKTDRRDVAALADARRAHRGNPSRVGLRAGCDPGTGYLGRDEARHSAAQDRTGRCRINRI